MFILKRGRQHGSHSALLLHRHSWSQASERYGVFVVLRRIHLPHAHEGHGHLGWTTPGCCSFASLFQAISSLFQRFILQKVTFTSSHGLCGRRSSICQHSALSRVCAPSHSQHWIVWAERSFSWLCPTSARSSPGGTICIALMGGKLCHPSTPSTPTVVEVSNGTWRCSFSGGSLSFCSHH